MFKIFFNMEPKHILLRNADYLHILKKARKKQRNAVLKVADEDLLLCLCECALNVLNGNVPLKKEQLKTLAPHKCYLRLLGNDTTIMADRQKVLIQNGGFLPALLTPVLTIVAQLLHDQMTLK